jgi:hypothetical protein
LLQLRRHLRQVARPPSGFVIVFIRSLDLPYGSVTTLVSLEDLLNVFVLLAPSFYDFASYALVDGRMPMAWPKF